jgi:hypothetical protein
MTLEAKTRYFSNFAHNIVGVGLPRSNTDGIESIYLGLIQELDRDPNAPHGAKILYVDSITTRRCSSGG